MRGCTHWAFFSLQTPSRAGPLYGDGEYRARGRGLTQEALGKRQCAFPRVQLCIVAVYISICTTPYGSGTALLYYRIGVPLRLRRIIRKMCPSFVYKPAGLSETARVFQLATARATSCSGFLFLIASSFQRNSCPPIILFYLKKSGIRTLFFFSMTIRRRGRPDHVSFPGEYFTGIALLCEFDYRCHKN